jgi:hypothetical protein
VRIIRRPILLISMVATLTVAWPSPATSQTSSSCQFGELAYTMYNVNPDTQEVVVNTFNDFKLEGTLQRVLIKRQPSGDLDYTLCWTTAKSADSKTASVVAVLVLAFIAASCLLVFRLKKRPSRVVMVDLK